jgi:hypothetical protein
VEQQEATDNVYKKLKESTHKITPNETQDRISWETEKRIQTSLRIASSSTPKLDHPGLPFDWLHAPHAEQQQQKKARRFFLLAAGFFLTKEGVCTSRSAQVELEFELFVSPGKTKQHSATPQNNGG